MYFRIIHFLWLSLIMELPLSEEAACPTENPYDITECTAGAVSLDWTTPATACQEITIEISGYASSMNCNWEFSMAPTPSSPVISVVVDPGGSSNAGDELSVFFDGDSEEAFIGNYDEWCTPANEPAIESQEGATNVRVNFMADGAADGNSFTVRIIFFTNDVCSTADSPHVITLDDDFQVAALSTLNFPSKYDITTCYTKVQSPKDTEVVVEYKQFNAFAKQDPLYIFDGNQSPPVLLRAHSFFRLDKTTPIVNEFGTTSNNIQLVFNPRPSTSLNREGFLIVFQFRDYNDPSEMIQPDSFCNNQGLPGKECSCPHEPGQPTCDIGSTDLNDLVGNPEEVCNEDPATAGGFRRDLDFTATGSVTYLATTGFIDMVTNDDERNCRWRIVGPAGSNLLFQLVGFGDGADDVFSIYADGMGLVFRFTGCQSEFDLPISINGEQSVIDIRNPVILPLNRVTVIHNFRNGGFGISFALRVVDRSCQPTCINGGQCLDVCNCFLGFLAPQCLEVSISIVAVSPSTVMEGSFMIFECRANGPLQTTTRIEFSLSTSNTAIEGFDFDFINERPCIIPAGQSTGTVSILVIDDDHEDNGETVTLDVTMASGDITSPSVVTPSSISFTLSDDDSATTLPVVDIDFKSPKLFIEEGGMPSSTVTLTLLYTRNGEPAPIEQSGSIIVTVTPATATTADYNWAGTPIPYTASSGGVATLEHTFEIVITSDKDEESIESFSVMLSSITPSSGAAQLGSTLQSASIFIIDDDQEDFILVVDQPYLANGNKNDPLRLFAFTNQNSPLSPLDWTKKFFDGQPDCTKSTLRINGQKCGNALKCPKTNTLPAKRLGYYSVCYNFEGGSQTIGTSVVLQNDCYALNSRHTVTVYPDPSNPSQLDMKLKLIIRRKDDCAPCSNMIWKRNGRVIPNRGSQFTTSSVKEARGVFQVFRPYRGNSGWFAMVEVIVSECPKGMYKDSKGVCNQACPTCQNGGVCELNGMCKCPPCFFGTNCQYYQCEAGSFGTNKRIQCSQLHPSYAGNKDCRGLLFCYEGIYGCKCGCGWHGRNCDQACPKGKFGANCELTCHCVDQHDCDRISGVCQRGCADGFSGFNCQQTESE